MLIDVLDEPLLHSVRMALEEDIGSGDITAALIPATQQAHATVISRETAVLCGMAWFNAVFAELDTDIRVDWQLIAEMVEPGSLHVHQRLVRFAGSVS